MNTYRLIVGLEVHAELKTASKMFCGCKNDPFGATIPNIYTCPVCLGLPGALPTPNKRAIDWTVKVGLAMNCEINTESKFDRKHYFYPDLPKGYQLSQYDIPFCFEGMLATSEGTVGITRIHLEEDTAKLVHESVNGKKVSLIDFNRSGVPLIEIVTEPDIISPSQAKEYGKKLRDTLRYLEVSDCDMEQGGMRLEANISLISSDAPKGSLPQYKVEVKNINSFRFMEQAIAYEMERQAKILDRGLTPRQETRGWDSVKNKTFSQRTKEDAEDYRYFPDPDIPPIRLSKKQLEMIRAEIPELPDTIRQRWMKEHNLSEIQARLLSPDKRQAAHMDKVFSKTKDININPLEIANAIVNKKISYSLETTPDIIIKNYQKLSQTDDVSTKELTEIIKKVITENPDAATKFKNGETQVIGFFMGQVVRASDKKLDPQLVRSTLTSELSK